MISTIPISNTTVGPKNKTLFHIARQTMGIIIVIHPLIKMKGEFARPSNIDFITELIFRYGEEAEHRQWDSGGFYYPENYASATADTYQNQANKPRQPKKLPSPGVSRLDG